MKAAGWLAAGLALSIAGPARAGTWFEVGDAGGIPATAQVPGLAGALSAIHGEIDSAVDLDDMFCVNVVNPGAFSASTVGGASFDTQLFLFNAAGLGVLANDDASGFLSTLPVGSLTGAAGFYYVAITAYNHDPVSAGGYIFPPTSLLTGPTGPGGADPIIGWSGAGATSGTYTIELTGTEACAIPAPGAALLGAVGLGLVSRKRKSM